MKAFRKYGIIINVYWQRALTYRFSVITYRMGEIIEILAYVAMWTVIYGNQPVIKGFTLPEMITYVLFGNLLDVMIRNFLADKVSREIKDGQLSMFLVKPIDFFFYTLAQETGRISFATILSTASILIVIFFFRNTFIWNGDILTLLLLLVMVLCAFVSELLIGYLIGLIAFWIDETNGIFISIGRVKKFFSGMLFPLTLMPLWFVQLSYLFPFAYVFFVPAQLYLGKISRLDGLYGIGIQLLWIGLLYSLIRIVWARGLKKYEGVGI